MPALLTTARRREMKPIPPPLFDPYRDWLGISSSNRALSHYELLGIDLFESDSEVIARAAEQRSARLLPYDSGVHRETVGRMLKEIVAAKTCLLNTAKKAAYDKQYRQQSEPPNQPAPQHEPPTQDASRRWEIVWEAIAAVVLVLAGLCVVQGVRRPHPPAADSVPASPHTGQGLVMDTADFSASSQPATRSASDAKAVDHRSNKPGGSTPKPAPIRIAERAPETSGLTAARPIVSSERPASVAPSLKPPSDPPDPLPTKDIASTKSVSPGRLSPNSMKPKPPISLYLDDLQEFGAMVGTGSLGKHGDTGYPPYESQYGQKVFFRGRKPLHALSLYPPSNDAAFVTYSLKGEYRVFRATAAVLETSPDSTRRLKGDPFFMGGPASPLTFKVLGDGKLLWESRAMRKCGQAQTCEVAIDGVNLLELQVSCPSNNYYSWAAWIDPLLEK